MGGFTQDDGYVQGVAPMHCVDAPRIPFWTSSIFCDFSSSGRCVPKTYLNQYRYRYSANTVSVTVSRVNAYGGGVLARAQQHCPRVYAICRPELGWAQTGRLTTLLPRFDPRRSFRFSGGKRKDRRDPRAPLDSQPVIVI